MNGLFWFIRFEKKKKWDYVKIVKEKKRQEFGASQCFREERKMEELRGLDGMVLVVLVMVL